MPKDAWHEKHHKQRESQHQISNVCNSFPNDKFLDWFKLKALADDKRDVTEKLKFV